MKQKQINCFLFLKQSQQNKHYQYSSAAAQSHQVESGKSNNLLTDSTPGRFEVEVRTSRKALQEGRSLHAAIIKAGFELDIIWQNHIINVYNKCSRVGDARKVFDRMPEKNLVSWSVMVTGYAQNGCSEEAVKAFSEMKREGIHPSEFAYASVSRACASLAIAEEGDEIHAQAIKTGYNLNLFVGSALVDMYAKCGIMENARKLFDRMPQRNVVSWTGVIAGYMQARNETEVLSLYRQMQQTGTKPNQFTSSCVLSVCADLKALEQGKQVHSDVIKSGLVLDIFVGNSLIDMYSKCTRLEDARQVFEIMPEQDAISWNAMISAYSQNSQGEEAMKMFQRMQWATVKQDEIRFSAVLGACASLVALGYGKQIHSLVIKSGFESDLYAGNALVDMYAKCGGVEDACQVFNIMQEHDVVSWNAVILGCAQHGHGKKAIQLFGQMQEAGIKPDHVTFISVLSACNHSGLVDEGRGYFNSMTKQYGIARRIEHYACMVDLLGRARHLDEAYNLIVSMPFKPDSRMWGHLIGACRIHRNIELGIIASECLLQLEPQNAGIRVLLSNIYAEAGRWDDVRKVRKMMKDTKVVKEPGQSWIEIKESVHVFYAEDQSF